VSVLEMHTRRGAVPYHLGAGLLARVDVVLAPLLAARRAFVVSDENVAPLYARAVAALLRAPLLGLPAGEERKTLGEAETVARWLLAQGAERRDVVVAVGGGVVTDLVGFAASITLRGLDWVAAPTTLLGMVDAAVGGKTGVDLDLGKNLLGSFWQPAAVIADPLALATLDRRQLRSGMVEVVKAAVISPAAMQELVDRHAARLAAGDLDSAEPLLLEAVRVKAEIVAADEREGGRRAALNLGHTLGHALEAATGYRRFLHGEAVAWGILAALRLAAGRELLGLGAARAWAARLEVAAPLPTVADLEWGTLAAFIARDKKAAAGRVGWVLPAAAGVEIGVPVALDEAGATFRALAATPPGEPLAAALGPG
jgi:3-dehydroquinate synthase